MLRLPDLPVVAILDDLRRALNEGRRAVLEAPPGAGKSTVVPLALLDQPWMAGKRIVMLEPRRLAARAVASRLATTLGEAPGETVGYRMRLESRVGPKTRIEVVTEGILTRRLERDPALEDTALVIFDEFHERSLAADLGLALCLDAAKNLRPDLRILVMSATLDGEAVARLLDGAARITSRGRMYPVDVRYPRRPPDHLEREVAATVRRAVEEESGDLLVFLPGAPEIRRVARILEETGMPPDIRVLPLYGDLTPQAQQEALEPARNGARKIILATSIAETSLTIEGIRVVVDSGRSRRTTFDPASGMSRLETVPVSLAAAEQRRGRAGRLSAGVCYRVYTPADERRLPAATAPEILIADLAPLALDLAAWGTDAASLAWLDAPPAAHLSQARSLLADLGALDTEGRITPLGRRMVELGVHPRLARMLLAAGPGAKRMAAELAAILSERDFARPPPGERLSSLEARLDLLAGRSVAGLVADRGAVSRIKRLAQLFERDAGRGSEVLTEDAGRLLLAAYPDRLARRRGESGRYVLANGRGAAFQGPDSLSRHEFIVVAELDGGDREARIQLAASIDRETLLEALGNRLTQVERVEWNDRECRITACRESRFGSLVLDDSAMTRPDPALAVPAMVKGIEAMGIACLGLSTATASLRTRVAFLRSVLSPEEAAEWPDLSDTQLLATLGVWLGPYLEGITRREHLAQLDIDSILTGSLTHAARRTLEEWVPSHLVVPSGSRIPIDYAADPPRVSVRLQEVFGLAKTPTVVKGRIALALELLSPARRPVQITRDLESFWSNGYREVKKELKGRYPKHHWPDDPLHAQATARVRPQR